MRSTRRSSLDITHLPWDSELFGIKVYQVSENVTLTPARLPRLIKELLDNQVDLLYYLHDAKRSRDVYTLTASGFRFIDTRIVLNIELKSAKITDTVPWFQLVKRNAGQVNLKPLIAMSKDLAATSRFSADRLLKKTLILKMYKTWILKALEFEMADYWFGLGTPSDPFTFVTFKTIRPGEVSLSLIATRRDLRRKGYGSALLRHAFQALLAKKVNRVRVGMQLTNTKALAFYEKMGFRSVGSWYIFHWHR